MEFNDLKARTILFLEGIASIAIQFLILRQLTPFVGGSVIVTSIVISVFLAALAVGYRKGGHIETHHREVLSKNLFFAAVLIGLFTSYLFISILFHLLSFVDTLVVLWLYLLIFMVPMVYLVAQTIPLLVNFMEAHSAAGKAGNALLYSTIGNVAGGIFITLIVMYYLGVSWAVVFTSFIFLGISFIISKKKKVLFMYLLIVVPLILLINVVYGERHFVAQTAYANYEVREDENHTYFRINRSFSSSLEKGTLKGYPFSEVMKKIINSYGKHHLHNEVVVIGAGGFTLSADGELNASVHYVDIDGQIQKVAEKYFLKKPVNGTFSSSDARVFLHKSHKMYDFIVVDAYSNRKTIPEHLTSQEFYLQVSKHLKPNGLMISNIIADPFLSDDFSRRMDNTIRSAFKSCFVTANNPFANTANLLYVCTNSKHAYPNDSEVIYTDDNNQATVDFYRDRVW
jgi:predicted membrane-bound spermidine synthase